MVVGLDYVVNLLDFPDLNGPSCFFNSRHFYSGLVFLRSIDHFKKCHWKLPKVGGQFPEDENTSVVNFVSFKDVVSIWDVLPPRWVLVLANMLGICLD